MDFLPFEHHRFPPTKIATEALGDGRYALQVTVVGGGGGGGGQVVSNTWPGLEIARGNVPGVVPFNKFGYQPNIRAPERVIGALPRELPFLPPSAVHIEAISTQAKDTNMDVFGTRAAREIRIEGVDENFQLVSATIPMKGKTPTAPTTQTFLRVFNAFVTLTGAKIRNAGNITIRAQGNGGNFLQIQKDAIFAKSSHYTVPANKRLYISSADISPQSIVDVTFWQRSTSWRSVLTDFPNLRGNISVRIDPPLRVEEKTDVWAGARGRGPVGITYRGIVEDF